MKRSELLAALRLVAPALAAKPLVPVFSHLCFDGKMVIAYDDVVALRAPCPLDIQGALLGSLLLSILASSTSEEAVFDIKDSEVTVKLGHTRAKLAVLPSDEFLFKEPSRKGGVKLPLAEGLLASLRLACRCQETDGQPTALTGVTIAFGKKKATLYATDSVSVVHATAACGCEKLDGKAVILPIRFCELLLKMGKGDLIFTESGDLVVVGDGVELFGRVVQGADPQQYERVFEGARLNNVPEADVPTTLARCLERSALLNREEIELSYTNGRLNLYSSGLGGELRDSLKVDFGPDPVEVITSASHVARYLDATERIGFCDRCVLLEGKGFRVLVAVKTKQ